MIKKLVLMIACAAVSRIGLTILNLTVLAIIVRFLFNLATGYANSGLLEKHVFELFGQGVAIRLVAVGVLLIERDDILVFAGQRSEHDESDAFSRTSRPYGAVYLCFGLILEMLLEQTRIPLLPTGHTSVAIGIAVLVILITIASFFACVSVLHELWQTRNGSEKHNHPGKRP